MKTMQKGFTWIELMIVIAIIGILAAIALPLYQDYVSKSQVTRAYGEVSSVKTAIEAALNEGREPVLAATAAAGAAIVPPQEWVGMLTNPTSNILDQATISTGWGAANGAGNITVRLGENANTSIRGATVQLARTAGGEWTCTVTGTGAGWKTKFIPSGCTGATGGQGGQGGQP